MRFTNIIWTTAIIAAAIILTAVLSTATLNAATGGGANGNAAAEIALPEAAAPVAPRFLSETGLYSNVGKLKVDPRNRTLSPQHPLWSDGATKGRWVRLPEGSMINVADLANWELPVGTKFWKEFSFKGRKVETRFLWQTRKGVWVVASYAWNEQQTNALLALESGIANITDLATLASEMITPKTLASEIAARRTAQGS
jgi:hypothetical protein